MLKLITLTTLGKENVVTEDEKVVIKVNSRVVGKAVIKKDGEEFKFFVDDTYFPTPQALVQKVNSTIFHANLCSSLGRIVLWAEVGNVFTVKRETSP